MPFLIVRNDITKLTCDAVVNAANSSLLGGGGVDGAIHAAAGPALLAECKTLGGCETGEAKITGAYRLPAKYVIHTVGPVWRGGGYGERALLASCYENALRLARKAGCGSVAFPLISAGAYGYPKAEALAVASETIEAFLRENEMLVYLVIFDGEAFLLGQERFKEIRSFIDQNYVDAHSEPSAIQRKRLAKARAEEEDRCAGAAFAPAAAFSMPRPAYSEAPQEIAMPTQSLEAALHTLDESFSEMLLRKIDERGITDAACYKRANIDRKLFSKIRSDRLYKPRKTTALAFAVALAAASDFGLSMIVSPAYLVSLKTGFLTFGQSEYLVQALLFLILCLCLRRFRLLFLGSFLAGVLYGAILDLWRLLPFLDPAVSPPENTPIPLRIVYFILGMVLCSLAVAGYFHSYLYPQVYDFFVKAVSEHFSLDRTRFKRLYDLAFLIISLALSLLSFGAIRGIGWGTLVLTSLNGPIIGFFDRWIAAHVDTPALFPKLEERFLLQRSDKDPDTTN